MGTNEDVVFKTDGLERMRIFKRQGSDPGDFSDIDGVIQIFTNLHLDPGSTYNGDLIMPWGRWNGTDFAPGGNAGLDAGDLTMTEGDLAVRSGEFSLTNEDGLVLQTVSDGPDTRLILDMADLWVQDGNTFLGPKPGNPPGAANKNNLFVSSGQVFIGDMEPLGGGPNHTGLGPVIPTAGEPVLRIDGYGDFGFGSNASNHVVFIRSYDNPNSADTPDGIAIQLDSGAVGEPVTDPKNNYITFYDSSGNARGAIQGILTNPANNLPGVTYESGGADFAEYLEKMDPQEVFEAGEIVGIFGGKVARQTQGADHILVVTGAPAFLGNAPQENRQHLYVKVALMGQVPVLVRGDVTVGDYIIASGLADGTAVAIPLAALELVDLPRIVGRAWSDSNAVGDARRDGGGSGFVGKIVDEARDAVGKGWHPLEDPQAPPGPDVEGGITYITVAIGVRSINWGGIFTDLMTKSLQVPAPPAVPQAKLDALTKRVAQLEAALQKVIGAKRRER